MAKVATFSRVRCGAFLAPAGARKPCPGVRRWARSISTAARRLSLTRAPSPKKWHFLEPSCKRQVCVQKTHTHTFTSPGCKHLKSSSGCPAVSAPFWVHRSPCCWKGRVLPKRNFSLGMKTTAKGCFPILNRSLRKPSISLVFAHAFLKNRGAPEQKRIVHVDNNILLAFDTAVATFVSHGSELLRYQSRPTTVGWRFRCVFLSLPWLNLCHCACLKMGDA